MTTALVRATTVLVAVALALLAGWRVIATRSADRVASSAPQRALAWDNGDPAAWLALAQTQLDAKQPQAAEASARTLLSQEPLAALGYVILAKAAHAQGQADRANTLYDIAARRAPRDLHTRAWIIGMQLQDGQYTKALDNMMVLLRIAPPYVTSMVPLMTKLAAMPPFATALGHALATQPGWRWAMLADLLKNGNHDSIDQVFDTTQQAGGLSRNELSDWINYLTRNGLWGEAYTRWAGWLALPPGTPLPPVFNGSFERRPVGVGFGWRMPGAPGAIIDRVAIAGADGQYAARATFLGRRVPDPGFAQTLLLVPGPQRLHFRVQADNLRSDKGLQWSLACISGQTLAVSPLIQDSFTWKTMTMDFDVPAQNCPAQILSLINPGADGAGKIVYGTLWFDDFKLAPGEHADAAIQ